MASKPLTSSEVSRHLAGLVGQRAWGAALGHGSFLTVDFGEARSVSRSRRLPERQHGAWHVWLYCCAWRLDGPSGMIVASEDPREHIAAAVSALNGLVVEEASIADAGGCALQLCFENGTKLTTFSICSQEYEHWFVYLPGRMVITAGPGSAYSVDSSDGSVA